VCASLLTNFINQHTTLLQQQKRKGATKNKQKEAKGRTFAFFRILVQKVQTEGGKVHSIIN
jgi:hypothetical protein